MGRPPPHDQRVLRIEPGATNNDPPHLLQLPRHDRVAGNDDSEREPTGGGVQGGRADPHRHLLLRAAAELRGKLFLGVCFFLVELPRHLCGGDIGGVDLPRGNRERLRPPPLPHNPRGADDASAALSPQDHQLSRLLGGPSVIGVSDLADDDVPVCRDGCHSLRQPWQRRGGRADDRVASRVQHCPLRNILPRHVHDDASVDGGRVGDKCGAPQAGRELCQRLWHHPLLHKLLSAGVSRDHEHRRGHSPRRIRVQCPGGGFCRRGAAPHPGAQRPPRSCAGSALVVSHARRVDQAALCLGGHVPVVCG
mmetsp:Transcript_16019/g.37332  ORF Transcript_16019/g.37332 Transcript_16019/m.37332 type:complete len:308 (+) Transcript_16019:243-1166(+)